MKCFSCIFSEAAYTFLRSVLSSLRCVKPINSPDRLSNLRRQVANGGFRLLVARKEEVGFSEEKVVIIAPFFRVPRRRFRPACGRRRPMRSRPPRPDVLRRPIRERSARAGFRPAGAGPSLRPDAGRLRGRRYNNGGRGVRRETGLYAAVAGGYAVFDNLFEEIEGPLRRGRLLRQIVHNVRI